MKKLLFSTLAVITITLFNACEKSDSSDLNKENCKVTGLSVSGGANYSSIFSYDTKGYISSSSTTANFGPVVVTYQYNYTRDKNGRTISLESVYRDDQGTSGLVTPIKVVYDNKGERIIKLVEYADGAPYLEHNLKYNMSGLVTEYTNEYAAPDESIYNSKSLFAYNAVGQLTKISSVDNLGKIYQYKVNEQKGKMPSSEAYLIEHGLFPVDLLFGEVYSIVNGGVGSVQKVYSVENDNPSLIGTLTTKSASLNARGFPESIVYGDTDGNTTIVNYPTDCSVQKMN